MRAEHNGLEKARQLLLMAGPEKAAEVMKLLAPEERELLGAHIVDLKPVTIPVGQPEQKPLQWLVSLPPRDIVSLLAGEGPHSTALVVRQLPSYAAADVMLALDDDTRNVVAHRLATMSEVSQDVLETVDQALRLRQSLSGSMAAPPREPEECDPIPADFEEFGSVPSRIARSVLAEVDAADLGLAFSAAHEDLRQWVIANLPEDKAAAVKQSWEHPAPVRIRDIEAARERLAEALASARDKQRQGVLVGTGGVV